MLAIIHIANFFQELRVPLSIAYEFDQRSTSAVYGLYFGNLFN